MTQLSITELSEIADQFLRYEYGLTLAIPIKRNNRLRSTYGTFTHQRREKALYIELSGKLFDYADDSVIIDVLKHECIHYALFELGRDYRDGSSDFEGELKRLNVRSNLDKDVPNGGLVHLYTCNKCDRNQPVQNETAHRENCRGCSTRCCGAKLTYIRDEIHDGTGKVVILN